MESFRMKRKNRKIDILSLFNQIIAVKFVVLKSILIFAVSLVDTLLE